MDRCYHVREPGLGSILIPGCMGAAVYGKRGCTCGPTRTAKQAKDAITALEERVASLEALLGSRGAA